MGGGRERARLPWVGHVAPKSPSGSQTCSPYSAIFSPPRPRKRFGAESFLPELMRRRLRGCPAIHAEIPHVQVHSPRQNLRQRVFPGRQRLAQREQKNRGRNVPPLQRNHIHLLR